VTEKNTKTTEKNKSCFSHGLMLCKKRKYGREQYKKTT